MVLLRTPERCLVIRACGPGSQKAQTHEEGTKRIVGPGGPGFLGGHCSNLVANASECFSVVTAG